MKENKLTLEQEAQITNLLSVIIEQSNLSPDSNPLLIKVPFSKLQSLDMSFSEARELIRYINRKIGTNESYIDVLNGTILKYENSIGTMVTEVFEKLEDVDLKDEGDSLILWVRNLSTIKNDIENFFRVDILKSNLESRYDNYEIVVGKKRLEIDQNSNENDFCNILFLSEPKTPVGWDNIWEKIKGPSGVKLGGKDKKSIQNLMSNLNKKLKDKGIKKLFSQKGSTVLRNY